MRYTGAVQVDCEMYVDPLQLEANAIVLPYGDQEESKSALESFVTFDTPFPSAFIK